MARSLASVGVPTMNIEKQTDKTAGAGQNRALPTSEAIAADKAALAFYKSTHAAALPDEPSNAEHDYSDFIESCQFGNEDRAHEVLCLLGYRDHLETLNRALEAQHDELLAAAKEALTVKRDLRCANGMFQSNVLRAAIAKCEGGAK